MFNATDVIDVIGITNVITNVVICLNVTTITITTTNVILLTKPIVTVIITIINVWNESFPIVILRKL